MADTARKTKLAAAKKKLKQFQKTGRTPSNSPAPTSRNRTTGSGQEDPGTNHNGGTHDDERKAAVSSKSSLNSSPAASFHSPARGGATSPHTSTASADRASEAVHNRSNHHSPAQSPANHRPTESTERLHQLTQQVNGLISETSAFVNNTDRSNNSSSQTDMEVRNQELAALLEKHTQANEQLTRQLGDLKNHNLKLQHNLETEKKGFEDKLKREIGSLKEQLQVHIQTIGILVAEKTELQSSLNQNQKVAEKRLEEVEELSGRLKASRQRVADLERSFTTASSSNQKHEQSSKEYSKDVDRLKLDVYKLNKSNEEFQQQLSEVQAKLHQKVSECGQWEDQTLQLKGALEMAQLHATQLQNSSGGADAGSAQQIEQLLQQNSELEKKLLQYEESFSAVTSERDELSQQYQQYIEQLRQQGQHLQTQINSLVEERDQWTEQNQQLNSVVQGLRDNQDATQSDVRAVEAERERLASQLQVLGAQLQEASVRLETHVQDNSQLSSLVMEKEERLVELELTVQRLSDNQVDKDALLDTIQSDKTALSRAMAQNKELKHQLAELQNGFVKMSNENMELMTQIASEQHVSKELSARLTQQEDELKDIREHLAEKEQQLQSMRANPVRQLSSDEMEQKMKDFQEQTPLLETLQRELASAQDAINGLTNMNSELRAQLAREASTDSNSDQDSRAHMDSATIRQLELERNQVIDDLSEERSAREDSEAMLKQLRTELAMQTPATLNGDVINKAQFEALQHAMKQLEGKYTKTMRDKADLTDKTEELEHIIMQLQGETDTIGEYVSLYQTQRTLLKERQLEKDDYIQRLARDRGEMQEKLGELQALVMQLLGERQMLHNYHANQSVAMTTANHVPHANPGGAKPVANLGGKLDSSQLEDWPDYTSSDDSDDSEVEPIVGGRHAAAGEQSDQLSKPPQPADSQAKQAPHNIPADDQTAQKIMHLLTEIGTSNLVERTSDFERSFLHCSHCSGRLLVL